MRHTLIKNSRFHVVLIIAGLTVLVILPLLFNPALGTRRDAVHNIGIVQAIIRTGIPPQNPFMAGEHLYYYWFYNALVAALTITTPLDPGMIMILLNLLSFLVLLSAVYLTVGILVPAKYRLRSGGLALILVVFGMNGWGWFRLIPLISEFGLSRLIPTLGGRVWDYLNLVTIGGRGAGRVGFLSTKFLIPNAFSLSLATMGAALYLLIKYCRKRQPGQALLFILFTTITTYLNLITGAIFIFSIGCFFCLWLVLYFLRRHRNFQLALYGLLFLGICLAMLAPYLYSVLGGVLAARRAYSLAWPDKFHLHTFALVLSPLLAIALITYRKNEKTSYRAGRLCLLVFSATCCVSFLCCRLLRYNELKMLFLAAAGISIICGTHYANARHWQQKLSWLIALSAIPTTLLGLIAYSFTPPSGADSIPGEASRMLEWITDNTPQNTVICTTWGDYIPMLAERDTYFCRRNSILEETNKLYSAEEFYHRDALLKQLNTKGRQVDILRSIRGELHRPIMLLRYGNQPIPESGVEKIYSSGDMDLWRLEE